MDGTGALRQPVVTYPVKDENGYNWQSRISLTTGKVVFYVVDKNGQKVENTNFVNKPQEIEEEKSTLEFFRFLTKYQFKLQRQEINIKDQELKPTLNDENKNQENKPEIQRYDDYDDEEEKSKWTAKDFKGYKIEWVRAKISDLPKRTIANCMFCNFFIDFIFLQII